MKEKLEFLIKNKGLSSTSLARLLEIQPSGVSHIMSGRNKPSFDLVTKILRAFPDINPDWLLLDADEPFRSGAATPTPEEQNFDLLQHQQLFAQQDNIEFSESLSELKNEQRPISSVVKNGTKRIARIIVLYEDHSFESYSEF